MSKREPYTTTYDEDSGRTLPTDGCPECAGTLRTDGGEHTCTTCGLVVDTYRLAHDVEPRTFEDTENKRRTGAPLTQARHDRGLSTTIGYKSDGNGNRLSGKKQRHLTRLRREHRRGKFQSKAERNLAHGCSEIARLIAALGLSTDLREQASTLFRSAQNENLLLGRSIEGFAAGSVYAACRCNRLSRTLDDIAAVAQVARHRVTNAYDVLNRELGLPAPPRRPRSFIPRLSSALGLSPASERRARRLATDTFEAGLSTGVHPAGFAVACLGIAAAEHDERVTQAGLARAADVSPTTVRNNRREIKVFLEEQA